MIEWIFLFKLEYLRGYEIKHMKNNILKSNKGFTLVETLVAITILMISIAGPLTVAQKSLMAAIYAKDQVTASFLAQDLVEQIKNDRDREGFTPWFNTFTAEDCVLKVQNNIYNCSSGTTTKFRRTSAVQSVSSYEKLVTVIVTWDTGTLANQMKIESHLFDISPL